MIILHLCTKIRNSIQSGFLRCRQLQLHIDKKIGTAFQSLLPGYSRRFIPVAETLKLRTGNILPINPHQYRILLGMAGNRPKQTGQCSNQNLLHIILHSDVHIKTKKMSGCYGAPPKVIRSTRSIDIFKEYLPIFLLSFYYLLLRTAVIRRLTCNRHIVRMALHNPGIGDAGKLGIMQFLDVGSTTISHTGTQTTGQLVNHFI